MAMSERTLVDYLLNGMRTRWRKAVKHADAYTAGIADVSAYIEPVGNVWIECKDLRGWPARPTTPVKVDMDDLQREFLSERKGWLLLRVGREYLLFDHNMAYWIIDTAHAVKERLTTCCEGRWKGSINWHQFAEIISTRRNDERLEI